MRRTAILAIVAMLASLLAVASPLSAAVPDGFEAVDRGDRASGNVSSDFRLRSPDDIVQVFIQLDEPAVAELAAQGAGSAAQKAQGNRVLAQQASFRGALSDKIVEELSDMQVAANGLRVKVRAGDIPAIRAMDGVLAVTGVTRYYATNEDSVPWIGGDLVKDSGWGGDGVTIAVIDTGIDYTHAAFDGPGTVEAYDANQKGVIEPGTFPTAKVIGGFDFAGPAYNPCGDPAVDLPSPDADPLDGNGHGTHVAGTAAGYGSVDTGEGMAPDALLYAFKVFNDTSGCTDLVSDALERALDPNNDLDTADHVDVVNMSLGSDYGTLNDPSSIAAENAVAMGIVVVSSSGNAGDNPYITGSPALADGVISVAASVDAGFSVNGLVVNEPEELEDPYEMAIGDFGSLDEDVTGDLVETAPFDACAPLTNAAAVAGNIAFLTRGTCDFTVKLQNAQAAGAIAAVVRNNAAGAPIVMGQNGEPDQPTIPGVMVRLDDGDEIRAELPGVNVTLSDDIEIPVPGLDDTMADFSSRGPGEGNGFKPDVSAPGFGIISADAGSGDGGASSNGTSMAAPHIAGLAAQVLEKYPDLEPAEVKALIMNSARNAKPESVPIARQGTGVAQADVAVLDLEGFAAPAGVSFGRINPLEAGNSSHAITVTRLPEEGDATYDIEFTPRGDLSGVTLEPSVDSLTTSDGSGAFDITLSWDPDAMPEDDWEFTQTEFDGWLTISNTENADDTMVVGVMAVMDPASDLSVDGGEGSVDIANGGAGGLALGYNFLGEGDETNGSVKAAGYTTWDGGGYQVLEVGLGLDPTETLNPYEIDVYLDVDDDGAPDYAIVAIDHGLLTAGEFNGLYVTALFDLNEGGSSIQWGVGADYNDETASLLIDLTGDFGINPPGDTMSADVYMFDVRDGTLSGFLEGMTIDVGNVIETEIGNFVEVPANEAGTLAVSGEGEMLWLFPNNQVGAQYSTTTVTQEPVTPPPSGAKVATVGSSTGFWELWDAGEIVDSFYYGNPGDLPFMGDWDGDGEDTPGLYRQSDGFVYLRNSNTQGVADITFFFGNPGDVPIVGDFDGDGFDTVSIYRPSEARFYIINELGQDNGGLGAADYSFIFGNPGDVPFVGDWNGDGIDTPGLRRASDGFVYLRNSNTQGNADISFFYGNPGDVVFAGDWNADGKDSIGLYRPFNGTVYLRNALSTGIADSSFVAGPGRLPTAGDF